MPVTIKNRENIQACTQNKNFLGWGERVSGGEGKMRKIFIENEKVRFFFFSTVMFFEWGTPWL